MEPDQIAYDDPQGGYTRAIAEQTVGRRISRIWFGRGEHAAGEHTSERLKLVFTDGAVLDLQLGTNLSSETDSATGFLRRNLRPDDVDVSFVASFQEAR